MLSKTPSSPVRSPSPGVIPDPITGPVSDRSPAGYTDIPPDLVVEVTSPSDVAAEVQEKIEMWLKAGVRMVIQAYPQTRSVAVYRSASEVRLLGPDDTFDGADVVPGFRCLVRDFFPE